MDGWNTIVSFWVSADFQGRTVSFREGTPIEGGTQEVYVQGCQLH